MSWRLAKSLETLRNQVDAAYPNRSKAADGTIGDAAHAGTASDHNPNSAGVVCALDLTHDPANGFDAHKTADALLSARHPNLKYIISNNRIADGWSNWLWLQYYGSNPHNKHIHISVGVGEDGKSTRPYDDTNKWNIQGGNDVSTLGDYEIDILWPALFGYTADDNAKKAWRGQESNTAIRSLISSPSRQAYEKYLADLKEAATGGGGDFKPVDETLYRRAK